MQRISDLTQSRESLAEASVCLQDAVIGNAALKTAISTAIRFGNTFAGGAQWVW